MLSPEVHTRYMDHLQKVTPWLLQKMEAHEDIEQFLCFYALLHACKHCHVHCDLTSSAVIHILRWDCMTPSVGARLSSTALSI